MAKQALDMSTAQHHAQVETADQDKAQLSTSAVSTPSLHHQIPNQAQPGLASTLGSAEARAVSAPSASQATSVNVVPDADASTMKFQAAATSAPSASQAVTTRATPDADVNTGSPDAVAVSAPNVTQAPDAEATTETAEATAGAASSLDKVGLVQDRSATPPLGVTHNAHTDASDLPSKEASQQAAAVSVTDKSDDKLNLEHSPGLATACGADASDMPLGGADSALVGVPKQGGVAYHPSKAEDFPDEADPAAALDRTEANSDLGNSSSLPGHAKQQQQQQRQATGSTRAQGILEPRPQETATECLVPPAPDGVTAAMQPSPAPQTVCNDSLDTMATADVDEADTGEQKLKKHNKRRRTSNETIEAKNRYVSCKQTIVEQNSFCVWDSHTQSAHICMPSCRQLCRCRHYCCGSPSTHISKTCCHIRKQQTSPAEAYLASNDFFRLEQTALCNEPRMLLQLIWALD